MPSTDADSPSAAGAEGDDGNDAKYPSADVILNQTRILIAAQGAQITALDGKANFSLASAALLTNAAVGLQAAVKSARTATGPTVPPSTILLADVLTCLALATFAAVVLCAFLAYALRKYERAPNPRGLRSRLRQDVEETQREVIDTLAEVYARNSAEIDRKVFWTRATIACVGIEGLILVAMAAVQLTIR